MKERTTARQQLATKQMKPHPTNVGGSEHIGFGMTLLLLQVGVGALRHGLSWSITCALFLTTAVVVVTTPSSSPPYPIQKTKLDNKASKNAATKQMTPPSRRRGSTPTNWIPNATSGGLGALLPGLVLYLLHLRRQCPYRHHRLHIPQGYPKGNRMGQVKREK